MKTHFLLTSLSCCTLFFLGGCSVFGIRSGYEQVDYTVIEKVNSIEVRQYPERTAVEVKGAEDRNSAFSLLFDYISGANRSQEKIAMTAPVQMDEKTGEEISMSAPVELLENGKVMMRFFLPQQYTEESAPEPTNNQLEIKALPTQTAAVLTYSGSSGIEKFERKKKELLTELKSSDWAPDGSATFMGYDPPFTIPFLKRNEVSFPVKKIEAAK